jgi:hypothetical protein
MKLLSRLVLASKFEERNGWFAKLIQSAVATTPSGAWV